MYYNGKKDFYFKQYGIPILTLAFSMFLVGSGVYIYWATSTSNTSRNTNNIVIASDNLKDVKQTSEINLLTDKLNGLRPLEKSEEISVSEIKDDASLVLSVEDKQIQVNLLGVDTTKTTDSLIEKMKEDLENKNVKISFEETKINGSQIYAYVYINENTLYNEKIIENGLATINKETKNLTYQTDLIQAQAYAKQLAKGVWKR